jgi:hypothetical protein
MCKVTSKKNNAERVYIYLLDFEALEMVFKIVNLSRMSHLMKTMITWPMASKVADFGHVKQ